MMALGFFVFKWRKRRSASVYDRPPPPGIYGEGEKRDAEVTIAYAGEEKGGGAGRQGGVSRQVSSWTRGTADRYSRGAVAAPAPVFASPGSDGWSEVK
ncbi:hypothetical protein IMZ48_16315, partial [Candidatus Bathyarchaeota archaeon]|nr:hypothetical protein [Candidatus Bathyarchaeota archaeon]